MWYLVSYPRGLADGAWRPFAACAHTHALGHSDEIQKNAGMRLRSS